MIEDIAGPFPAQCIFQGLCLQYPAAGDSIHVAVRKGLLVLEALFVDSIDHLQAPLHREPVAVGRHLRNLVGRIDVNQREGDMAEEGLPGQPEKDRAVFPDGPEHPEAFKIGIGLPQNVNADIFQLI